MIFQELSKFRRESIMRSVVMIAVGILMIICPENYITMMIGTLGSVMLVFSVIGILEFFSSNKVLIHYIYLTGWLIIGIIGTAILLFQVDSLYTISWLFGAYLVLSGLHDLSNALTYARRSGREHWWILVVLACILIVLGVIVFVNPWVDTVGKLFKVVGYVMLFSSFISILRMFWIWPLKSE